MNVSLSLEQKYAISKFNKGENLFITGPGGTGKSKLIHEIIDQAKKSNKTYQVCALTGCAAILLNCGARTIHSWSGIKLGKGPAEKIVNNVLRNRRVCALWRKTNVLIVDEVSMLSAKVFDVLDAVGRAVRKCPRPFGGIQLVFTGDFFQLPPVAGPTDEAEYHMFCFQSELWNKVFPVNQCVVLTTIFRQTDETYIEILNEIRKGTLSAKNVDMLRGHVNRTYLPEEHNGCVPTKLFPIRSKVDAVNQRMFEQLSDVEYEFEFIQKTNVQLNLDSKKPLSIHDRLKTQELTSQEIERETDSLVQNTRCARSLSLKKGAVVMCTTNLNMELGICNGAQGIVLDFVDSDDAEGFSEIPLVRFANGITMRIGAHYWQSEEYPTIAVAQIPLCLAWAMTIHKIQGATMKMAEMDIGSQIFEYGQTYVALSRIQSLDGLYLSSFQPDRIKANPHVISFYESITREIVYEPREVTQEPILSTTRRIVL